MESLVQLLEGLKNSIDALQKQLEDAQASLAVEVKEAYDKGFVDGVASVPKVDKLYSQEEADAFVLAAVEPLQAEISGLLAKIEELGGSIQPKIDEAIAAFKAELKAKYQAAQAEESGKESEFGMLLE